MPEIKLQLNDPKVLEAVEWYLNRAVRFDIREEAYRLVRLLPKYMEKTPVESPDFQLAYERIILRAKFIALDRLGDDEIVDLLQNNFSVIFEFDLYDLWEKVRAKLLAMPEYEKRDELKKKIREALLVSGQALTREDLLLDNKKVKGTVKNWLTDYNRTVGGGKAEVLKLSQYLVNSPNTKTLSEESRKKLDYLLKFYEKMKLSSLDYDGIEETMVFITETNKMLIFKDGQTERPSRETVELVANARAGEQMAAIKEELKTKYQGGEEAVKKVKDEMAKILNNTNGDFRKLADLLFEAANPAPGRAPDKIQVEAVLKILAEQGKLENLLEEKKFNEMMAARLRETGRAADLEGFKINSRAPQHISAFLRHILMDKIGMSEDDSGRLGMQLFNALAKGGAGGKYQGLVYFDLEKKEFKWS